MKKKNWNECELVAELGEKKLIEDLINDNLSDNYDDSILSEQKTLILEPLWNCDQAGFEILHIMDSEFVDIIDDIFFCFENGDLENWLDIFNCSIDFIVGATRIHTMHTDNRITMEYNLLLNKLMDKNIVKNENEILIPISFIILLKNAFKKYTNFSGYGNFLFHYHHVRCFIISKVLRNIKLKVIYRTFLKEIRSSFIKRNSYISDLPIFGFSIQTDCLFENNFIKKIKGRHITKLIIIKIISDEQEIMNVHKINLYLNSNDPISYSMYDNEIIEVNNFGKKYFIIALSPSFKNSKSLSTNLQTGNLDKYGIDLSRIDNISLEIQDIGDNVEAHVCMIHGYVARCWEGMIRLAHNW
ncbi:hypothetical protein Catovirus_1_502 [Catovirus CTV1]|uniref:Uncharacterized protein n=1 Tax=Catovirus CTV1 TaxID=1977631 RepID=A0A1V0S9S1_9VIRU|nr:hypothetical protein Catovirus_1_502 [Catovirus CTV1]